MVDKNTTPKAMQLSEFNTELTVDARDLRCPLPLLKAKQALHSIQPGQCVRVLATDKGSVRDFHTFARLSGNELVHFGESQQVYEYILRKAS